MLMRLSTLSTVAASAMTVAPIALSSTPSVSKHFVYDFVKKERRTFEREYSLLESVTSGFGSKDQVAKVGSGAQGEVFSAHLPAGVANPRVRVAVKRLNQSASSPPGRSASSVLESSRLLRVKEELLLLSKLDHPNIIPLLGISTDGPSVCLVYGFMDKGTLFTKLKEGREGVGGLAATQRLVILSDVGRAIAYLEDNKVVHRDIKSANIMLENHPAHGLSARLGDFGISRSRKPDALTMTHINTQSAGQGTPLYLAPECGRGDYSNKSDVYAYAMVILETLTGLPLENPTPVCLDRGLLETEVCSNLHLLWENRLEDEVEAFRKYLDPKTINSLWDKCASQIDVLHAIMQESLEPRYNRRKGIKQIIRRLEAVRMFVEDQSFTKSADDLEYASSVLPAFRAACELVQNSVCPEDWTPISSKNILGVLKTSLDELDKQTFNDEQTRIMNQRARAASDRVLQAATRAADH